MANTRLERIGTIYSRVTSLLEGKAWTSEHIPIWYNIYKAFPPKLEPKYDRVAPKIEIKDIFYKEDIIRAKFQKEYNNYLRYDFFKSDTPSITQKFLAVYNDLEKSGIAEEELYEKAIEKFKLQNPNFGAKRQSVLESSGNAKNTSESDKLKQ
ncbi:28S ribosomal protein S23, mitochondrial [Chelonus insularis]|uniref:28S ribosomal protein S23, mitochondrial n=1 Tax=Chelonus insularis TaxID=460826 RepID=UPI00158D5E39|nr:28S ribosomal protein S23, mitochondrial [Chelonus insularis]